MNVEKLTKLLALHEGRVPHAYQDSLGYWTIGIGHLIDKAKGGGLPEHIIDALFAYDLEKHAQELFAHEPWIAQLDEVRKAVLVDMAFNLGVAGLRTFVRTLTAVKEGRYNEAAALMLKSKWATQVGKRAQRLSWMMSKGVWPPEVA